MIKVEAVEPNAHELRMFTKGWGAIHWVCCLPTYAHLVGLAAFGFIVFRWGYAPAGAFAVCLIGSWLLWYIGMAWQSRVTATQLRKSPAGRLLWTWNVDETGLRFDTRLQLNSVDWRGVKAVREESDRFLFLVTPSYNPVLPKRLMTQEQIIELQGLISEVRASGRLGAGVD